MIFINPDFEKEELLREELDRIALFHYGKRFSQLCEPKQRAVINLHKAGFLNDLDDGIV